MTIKLKKLLVRADEEVFSVIFMHRHFLDDTELHRLLFHGDRLSIRKELRSVQLLFKMFKVGLPIDQVVSEIK